jgi:dihydrofolate reductase
MRRAILAAVSSNGVIGRNGRLPWQLKGDLQRFRALTMGHWLIMGRRTYESIGRPLPGRQTVVLTRRSGYPAPKGVLIAPSLDQAFELVDGDEIFIVGGENVFREALRFADRLYLTEVDAVVQGDARFPEYDRSAWLLTSREQAVEPGAPHAYAFAVYDRKPPAFP